MPFPKACFYAKCCDGEGGSGIQSVVGGSNISVDNTDPQNPVINNTYTAPVGSVNGQTGIVNLTASDVGAAQQSQVDFISAFIENPSDKEYKLVVKSPYGGTITETTTIAVSGTATATFSINGIPLGGSANSVSNVEQSQVHGSANVFAAGDDIEITISSNSFAADLSITIAFTRILA